MRVPRRALRLGIRNAEALMVDTLRVVRVSRVPVEDGLGGASYPTSVVYEGAGKIQTYEPHEQPLISGGQTIVSQRYHAHLPLLSGPYEVGDVVEVVAASETSHAVGDKYRVAGLNQKSLQTAQRLLVDELVKGPTNG